MIFRYGRRGPSDKGRVEPATTVLYVNPRYQSESSSSDAENEPLPAIETQVGVAGGFSEGEDHSQASMVAMAGGIERL
ncbi:hypothetical protein J6590_035165 [Homalodisca vitripennis]|nr:hypothetical protein J6590_035165 [Homalodisca vitripennis]